MFPVKYIVVITLHEFLFYTRLHVTVLLLLRFYCLEVKLASEIWVRIAEQSSETIGLPSYY